MLSLLTGLAAGGMHVLSGPDHLAALSPLAVDNSRQGAWIGATWGAGHGAAVVLMGALALSVGASGELSLVSAWSERAVGVLLLGVGAWSLLQAQRLQGGTLPQGHHHHRLPGSGAAGRPALSQLSGAAGIGLLHGTAGAGHLLGVFPVLALEPAQGAAYLVCYLLGAMVTMAAFGGALGQVVQRAGQAGLVWCMRGSGLLAILVGVAWLFVSHE